jgi:hypothetical protein
MAKVIQLPRRPQADDTLRRYARARWRLELLQQLQKLTRAIERLATAVEGERAA